MQPVLSCDPNGKVIEYGGKVQWFDCKKGYGFISCPAVGPRGTFVHWSNISGQEGFRKLSEGDEVIFNTCVDPAHGLIAVNVVITKKAEKEGGKKHEKRD